MFVFEVISGSGGTKGDSDSFDLRDEYLHELLVVLLQLERLDLIIGSESVVAAFGLAEVGIDA